MNDFSIPTLCARRLADWPGESRYVSARATELSNRFHVTLPQISDHKLKLSRSRKGVEIDDGAARLKGAQNGRDVPKNMRASFACFAGTSRSHLGSFPIDSS